MGTYKGFDSIELRRPTRSTFNLSHEKRISSRIGKLTPVFISETMPNDTFRVHSEVLVKLAPMIAPIFHRLNLYVHYFFVPNRLLYTDWEKFITGGRLGAEVTTPPVPPNFGVGALLSQNGDYLAIGSLADYLGLPPMDDGDTAYWGARTLDLMPFAAFYKCWYDWYRDRNFVADDTILPLASGTTGNVELHKTRYRCWEHDYFTSAQTSTQRGAEVLIPMEGSANLVRNSATGALIPVGRELGVAVNDGELYSGTADVTANLVPTELAFENSTVSINDLRRANRLQEWLERNQLAGSRYNESIMAHFGRRTSDSRLQRAEYLGGGKAVIQISEVMTTAFSQDSEDATVPPGNPVGRGSTYANTNGFSYNCEEHGFVIGILSVLPTSGYMQGIPRMFQARNTFLDYPWPTFANLGEQEVYDYEIAGQVDINLPVDRTTAPVFGYQSRYSDWKYIPSSSHGDFRSSLDFWHLTRKFSGTPNLDGAFVTFEDELQDRVFNVSDVDTLWMYVYNKVSVKRSLPYFGTPKS